MSEPDTISDPSRKAAATSSDDIISILLRNKFAFLSALLGTLFLTVLALIVIQTRYVATGSVIVAEPEIGLDAQAAAGFDRSGDPADMESQILLVKAARVLRIAVDAPDVQSAILRECQARGSSKLLGVIPLGADVSCSGDIKSNDKLLDQIQQHYSISASGRSRVITIAYDSPLADVSQTMANALTTAFLNDRRAAAVRTREEAANWLKQQIAQLQASLKEDEDRIQAFRRKNGLVKGGVAPISSERLSSASQSLNLAESARAEALARLNEVKKAKNGGLNDLPTVIASRTIGDLKQQMATIAGQIASNSATLGPRHPSLIALQQEQDSLRRRMDIEMTNIAASAQRNFDAADATVNSLRQQLGKVQSDAGAASDDEASIADLVRDAEIKRTQYAELTKKVGDLETQKRVLAGTTRLVSLAELPIIPFFPKKIPFLAGGLTVGAILGFVTALMVDRRRKRVVIVAKKPQRLDVPSVAVLPQVDSGVRNLTAVLTGQKAVSLPLALRAARHDGAFQGGLSDILAAIDVGSDGASSRSVLFTSPEGQHGRTLTAVALAQQAAMNGRRVLLVETDFDRPVFSKLFNLAETPGARGILARAILPQAAIFATDTPNLFTVPAGQPGPKSRSETGSDGLYALLRWATRFNMVIFDGPPNLRGDKGNLSSAVDCVFVCARSAAFASEDVAGFVQELTAAGAHVAGTVKTMAEPTNVGQGANAAISSPAFARAS